MTLLRSLLLTISAVAALPQTAGAGVQPAYSYYEIGKVAAPRPAQTEQALLLVGGGDWDREAFRWFAGKAGHGHVVVIAASGSAEDNDEFYREVGGLASVQTIVFHDRAAAFDRRVLGILRRADGIFIAGGDQSNYVRYWKGTPVSQSLDAHIASGRPIGGTSAGLAILGSAGYGAMDGGSVDSATALQDPLGPAVTIVRDFLHMPHMRHIVTDTHFMARNRLGRLIAFVAQVRATSDPRAVGLGIDEGSALCVDARGRGRFFTSRNGSAWLVQPVAGARPMPGRPLDSTARVTRFGPKGSIDLKTLRVAHPTATITVTVQGGVLSGI